MIAIDDTIYDADVLRGLAAVLGGDTARMLRDAFEAELRRRPAHIAMQVATGDVPGARAGAHALKGAALTVGARRIAALAGQIEHADPHSLQTLTRELMGLPGIRPNG